ncbi:amidophosphoribosyltransferase [Blattabacterium cuenoti]|uniref:amidophosphoribosyltransferase n=1 Tax=Blattabacterium cuenoti TaxID=1653831 RepID=UPI00163C4BB0|nr:amidophosphoribosyltransferase [Blattabacterium cuenoti]
MIYSDKFHEECGVFGIYSPQKIDTFSLIQFGLFALQHRGQEACGFSVLRDGFILSHKSEGLVLDSFREIANSQCYHGNAVIGHTRYSTEGGQSKKNIQPFFGEDSHGRSTISIVHNGNLINAKTIRKNLESKGITFISEYSDSEVILRLIQKYLHEYDNILEMAIQKTTLDIQGAYSVIVLMNNKIAAFRDPNGIRPLCYGMLNEKTYIFSSETCGIDSVGGYYIRDLFPGEMAIVDQKKSIRFSLLTKKKYTKRRRRTCSFEYIYFSRPDSLIENMNVYELREKSGEKLYEQYPVEADVVIGVPDSGVPASIGFSKASGIPFKPILVKNKYIGRSFILPKQEIRERIVNLKLNPILDEIKGKRIVIVDDSIVRGTTSRRLVSILRKAGAREIHFRSASPPIIAPCFLGVDTPSKKDLISHNMNKEKIAEILDVDSLEFLNMKNLIEILGSKNYCFGCFTGNYPVVHKKND